MKKVVVICLLSIMIMLCFYYLTISKEYKSLYKEYEEILPTYNQKLNEYNEVVKMIEDNFQVSINDYNDIHKLDFKYSEEIDNLEQKKKKLISEESTVIDQKQTLVNKYNKLVEEDRKKNTYMISNVETLNQYSLGYPNGCESVSLAILLHYYNVNVSLKEIVNRLKKGDLPHYEGKIRYGGNPYLEFIGNPAKTNSYGVYDKPIEEVANYYKSGIINATGTSLDKILEIVKQKRPVLVWTSNDMKVPYINQSWIYKPTGQKISWMKNLHAVVLIGKTKNEVIVSDPINGKIRYFDKSLFESRYNAFGKRALYY